MPEHDWVEQIGARSLGTRLFAASSRKTPALGPPRAITHIQLPLPQWDGHVGPWDEHFGKGRGQVHSLDGSEPRRSCQEVEIAKLLRTVRNSAFWFTGYNVSRMPAIWRPWVETLATAPDWLVSLDLVVRELISSRTGGMPDVVAWNDDDPLGSSIFVECKGPRESFKEAQEDWVFAARAGGIETSQIAVAIRPF